MSRINVRGETVSSNRVHKYKIHKLKFKYKIRTYTIRGGSVSCGKEQLFGFVRWLLLTTDPSVSWGLVVGFLGATNVATVHCSSIHKYAQTEIQILHTDNTNAIMNTTMTNEKYLSWSLVVGFLCATIKHCYCKLCTHCECHHILTTELFLNIDQNQSMLLVISLKKVLPEKKFLHLFYGFGLFASILVVVKPYCTHTQKSCWRSRLYSLDLQNELINSKGEFFIMMFLMSLLLLFLHIIVQCVGVGAGGLWELTVAAGWSAG